MEFSEEQNIKLELLWLQFIQWPPGSSYTFFSLIFLMMVLIISCYQKLLNGTHDTFGTCKRFPVSPQKFISVQIWPVLINLQWSSISLLQLCSHISLKTNFKCSVLNGLIAAESARTPSPPVHAIPVFVQSSLSGDQEGTMKGVGPKKEGRGSLHM